MKPIELLGTTFFELMRIQPEDKFYSTSLSLAFAMVKLDMIDKEKKKIDITDNKKFLERLNYIEENTHEDLKMPLAKVEAYVSAYDKFAWGTEREIRDKNDNDVLINNKHPTILDLYMLLKEAYTPIVEIVTEIIQPYSFEYRSMGEGSGNLAPTWLGGKEK